jgi:hypothetical protein
MSAIRLGSASLNADTSSLVDAEQRVSNSVAASCLAARAYT